MAWRRFVSQGWETRCFIERQVREEMQGHFESLVQELQSRGMSEAQAIREAQHRFGDFETHYRHGRHVRLRRLRGSLRAERLLGVVHDTRSAYRSLRARPGFALTAVAMLGVGVGATTLLFSLISAVLLEPLPFEEPARLFHIRGATLSTANNSPTMTREQVLDWRPVVRRSFVDVAAYHPNAYSVNLSGLGEPIEGGATEVTHNFFAVMGQYMTLGRYFTEADATGGVPPAVIGERVWRSHWGADPDILGRELLINGRPHRVVGVVPARAQLPADVDVWVPMGLRFEEFIVAGARYFYYVGRLRTGIDLDVAAADLLVLQATFEEALGKDIFQRELELEPLHESVVGRARSPLWLLFGGVAVLLLITLTNLASYLLVRARAREREYALRAALGAGRRRLLQQSFAESVIVSGAGMLAALAFASWSVGLVRGSSYLPLPRLETVVVDWRLFLFAAAVSIGCAVLFGLFPAWLASRPNILGALKVRHAADRGPSRRPRELLVVAQVALALVLAAGAGLLVRSYGRLLAVDNGYAGDGLTFAMNLDDTIFAERAEAQAFVEELRRRALAIPGVLAAGAVNLVPLAGRPAIGLRYEIEGEEAGDEHRFATHLTVTPGYLEAIGTELRAGRSIAEADVKGAAPVAVVTAEFVRKYIGSPDPRAGIGRRIIPGFRESEPIEIVGVVADVHRRGPASEVDPEIYLPLAQEGGRPGFFAVRSETDTALVAAELRAIVAELAPSLPIFDMQLMSERLVGRLAQPRLLAWLFSSLGVASVLLAAFGLYAVVAYWVTTRTHEIGVRLALGATRWRVFGELLRQGALRLAAGLVIGLGCYALVARLLDTTLLFGTGVYEPATLVSVVVVVALATLGGVAGAAGRVTRLDPLTALRCE